MNSRWNGAANKQKCIREIAHMQILSKCNTKYEIPWVLKEPCKYIEHGSRSSAIITNCYSLAKIKRYNRYFLGF